MDSTALKLITRFGMAPIPVEGGWFCQTWRSAMTLPAGSLPGHGVDRPAGTAILALFSDDADGFCALHRLATTEVWHFCGGDEFHLLLLGPGGASKELVLGPDVIAGHEVQVPVPAGTWMGGQVAAPGRFSLIGCTMAPGFTNDVFEAGDREELTAAYPGRAERIARLTRDRAGGGEAP